MWGSRVLQNAARVQEIASVDLVAAHFVEQGPQADAEPLRGLAAIAAGGRERRGERLTLRLFDRRPQRPSPFSPLLGGEGKREMFLPEIARLQELMVRQHRRPLDRVLELAHIPAPWLPSMGSLRVGHD